MAITIPTTGLTGLLAWIKADRGITSGGGAVADQGTLDRAADQSAAGNHMTCAAGVELTLAKPPSVRQPLIRAKWDFNADLNLAPDRHIDVGTFASSAKINPNNYLLGMVVRFPWWRKNGGQPIFWCDGGSNDFGIGYGYNSSRYGITHFGSASGLVTGLYPTMGKSVVVIRGTATETTIWWNDRVGVLSGNRGAGNSSGFHLGEIPTGANQPFDLFELVLCNDQNTAQIAGDLRTYLAKANNRSLTIGAYVVGLGDSILYGQNSTGSYNWQTLIDDLLPPDVESRVEATAGNKIADCTTAWTSYVLATLRPAVPTVVLYQPGTNDITVDGVSLATFQSRYLAGVATVRAGGARVVACTIPEAKPSDTAGAAVRATVNAWIRSAWSGFADGLSDRAAALAMSNDNAGSASVYYDSGDANKIHLSNLGQAVVAEIDAAAINRLLGRFAFTDLGGTVAVVPAASRRFVD